MAEVAIQEPCESLAGGETLLGSRQEESGWPPEEGRGQRNPSPLSGPEEQWKELGRKRHRRRPSKKKRPWKPYNKLTWEEKKRLEEREAQRASRVRAEMFAKGQPVAPYNTTQFLMDDHDLEEPDLCPPPPKRGPAVTAPPPLHINADSTEDEAEEDEDGTGSDGMASGEEDDESTDFLQKDFSETYEKYHVESLQDMSKAELIREYMELEKCLSRMEEDNNRLRSQHGECRQLHMELERVREENRRLLREREPGGADNPTGQ